MTTTMTADLRFRKTKTGEWVAYGPVTSMEAGCVHAIAKANGATTDFYINRVGKSFLVDGVKMAYGYGETPARATASRPVSSCVTGGNCSSFGSGRSCGAHDCDGY